MIKKLFFILLISYPFLILFPLRDDTVTDFVFITALWGVIIYIIYFFVLYNKLKNNKINFMDISSLIIISVVVISIMFSKEIVPTKFYESSKTFLPYLVGSMFLFFYVPTVKTLRITYLLSFYSIIILFLYCIYKLSTINFNIINIANYRDSLWDGRGHPTAFVYMGAIFLFFILSKYYSKNQNLKYVLMLPVFFIGVRSAFFGALVFLLYTTFVSKINKVYLFIMMAILGIIIVGFDGYTVDVDAQSPIMKFLSSEQSQKINSDEFDLNSFSSGRLDILKYYYNKIDVKSLIIGDGMSFAESTSEMPFHLHNDFYEYFFIYGIIGLIAFLYAFYYNIFFRISKYMTFQWGRDYIFGIMYYCIIVGFTTGVTSLYVVYVFVPIIILHKINMYQKFELENKNINSS